MGQSRQSLTVSATLNAATTIDATGFRGARQVGVLVRGTAGNLSAFVLQRKDIDNATAFTPVTDATIAGDTIAGTTLVAAGLFATFTWPPSGCPHNRLRLAITGAACVGLKIDLIIEKQTQELDATQFPDT